MQTYYTFCLLAAFVVVRMVCECCSLSEEDCTDTATRKRVINVHQHTRQDTRPVPSSRAPRREPSANVNHGYRYPNSPSILPARPLPSILQTSNPIHSGTSRCTHNPLQRPHPLRLLRHRPVQPQAFIAGEARRNMVSLLWSAACAV